MNPFPTGTITFLFTDVEGSARLWEAFPDQMRRAIARHDTLLKEAVEAHGGYLFKTTGDGIAAAFATAPDALAAALTAQRSQRAEPWPESVALWSRMGLYTGAAQLRDGDYFGPTLSRCARLMATGHGGQVLLADITHELCRDTVAAPISLRFLGEHRLKDLTRPETIYQLVHPELRDSFPPLRTLDHPDFPNNLPQQLTSFVGRETAVADICGLLRKTRLLTLTGSGGSGKTRLALQVAADVLEDYPDGVWLAELATLSDASLVAQTIASALGLREAAGQPIGQTIIDALKEKRLLLILDNAEHVLNSCAALIAPLLRLCPSVKALLTSREPLGIGGETTYRVPSLSLPSAAQSRNATAESLSQYETVRLFIERAQSVRPDFAVTNDNAPALAQLCYRLGGIPLAIELAAARVRALTVEQINERLDTRFRLLTGGDRTALPRQQTLRALVDWSYDLLTGNEKILLARLSAFAGGWSLLAAEAVCGFDPLDNWEVVDLLTSLVDKSLVQAEEADGADRYGMLETLRDYAAEKLAGDDDALRDRHRRYFVGLAEDAEPKLTGPEQAHWLNCLEAEHDNLRAALDHCASPTDPHASLDGLSLAGALSRFWWVRGYISEGREHLQRALATSSAMSQTPGDLSATAATRAVARALNGAGNLARGQGDLEAARTHYAKSLQFMREIDDRRGIANALNNLGLLAQESGDNAAARTQFSESLQLMREIGDLRGVANALNNVGVIAFGQADYVSAQTQFAESLGIMREIGDKNGIASARNNLGSVAHRLGDYESARAHHEAGLSLLREVGDKSHIAYGLEGLGTVCSGAGDIHRAITLWAAAQSLRTELGAPLPPADQEELGHEFAQARAALGDDEFAAVWSAGSALGWEQAVALALGEAA